jgi:hypothetical protein
MDHSAKTRLVRFVLTGGALALLGATALPVWTLWYENPMEGTGYHHSLWYVVWQVASSWAEAPNPMFPVTRTGDAHDFIVAGIYFCAGAALGAASFAAGDAFSSTQS